MAKTYEGHEFEALKMRYEDQVALLRYLTQFDFKIFVSFFTLQLFLGGWLSTNPVSSVPVQVALATINIVLAALSVKLLYNQHRRRQEVADTIKNINKALGFDEKDIYLHCKALNPPYSRRYWFRWYVVGVIVAVVGLLVVLFWP
ncbi:MAG TPA: hypothetical protein VET88_09040 [Gammaproteobacteria bacterium]|nr:hypothetical protein [Gammaproteobacteria bacterium]